MKVLLICFTQESDFFASKIAMESAQKYCECELEILVVVAKKDLEKARSVFNDQKVRFDIQPDNSTNNNGSKFFENYIRIITENINRYDHLGKIDSDTVIVRNFFLKKDINYAHKLQDRFKNHTIYGNFYLISKSGWSKLIMTYKQSDDWKTRYVQLNYGENRCIMSISQFAGLTFSPLPILNIDWFSNWSFKQKIEKGEAVAIHFWSKNTFLKHYDDNGFTSWLSYLVLIENLKRLPKSIVNFVKFFLKLKLLND